MSTEPRQTREIVLYVPAGGRSTAKIPRGSAIVGEPRFGAREVEVYFESAAPERRGLRTLADRALSASGRMLEHAVFGGCLLLPPKALTVVGILNFAEGSIALTGPQSERVVADWLGTPQLDQAELRESGSIVAQGHELMSTGPISTTHLEPALLYALLERGGVEPDGEGWRAPDGRRTVTVGDALIWALERIARGD
jgi:hypothetical protein